MAARKLLQILLMSMACTVVIYCRPMIDTSDIVKDIRDIENILNEADNDNDDNDDDSNDSTTSDSDSKDDEEEEADKDESTTSQESSDAAALKNVTNTNTNSSADPPPTITDVSNSTAESTNNTVASEGTKNAEIPSNTTEVAPAAPAAPASNATVPAVPSNDTTKPDPIKKGVIGVGQRLTSEQKDTPDDATAGAAAAALKIPAAASFTPNDIMNYTSAAILGAKDLTMKPAVAGSTPALYVTKESQEAPKVEEVKIKSVSEEKMEKDEEDDSSDEKEESAETAPKNDEEVEVGKNQKKDVAVRTDKVNDKAVSNVEGNKTDDENEEEGDDDSDDDGDDDDDGDVDENVPDKHDASDEDHKVKIEEEEVDGGESAEENEEPKSNDGVSHKEEDRVKMFFISPYEGQDDIEAPQTRQILTYPATTAHGWGHSHQWGPAHIWNSDYPYYAYGYSWGCGGHGDNNGNGNNHGTAKKSNIKANIKGSSSREGKSKEKSNKKKKSEKGARGKADWICRDYMLVPAAPHGPFMDPAGLGAENGVTRARIHGYGHDIACHDEDQNCKQRQVIGSMAGGSMFGDGMGGLGMGFPGVPGIHAGLSGYNAMGGLGDHKENKQGGCEHGQHGCSYHGGYGHGGGGGGGGGGGYGGGYGDDGGYGGGGGGRGGNEGGYGMNGYITGREFENVWGYQQPSYEFVVPRVVQVQNSVKKSYEPREYARFTNDVNYEDVGEAGNTQYTQDEPDERMSEKVFRKFGENPSSVSGGEYNANFDNKGIVENAFEDSGEKDLHLDKEYIGKLSEEGVSKTVQSALHNEKKLGLDGHISINGISKDFSYKSKIRKPKKEVSKEEVGTVRQDIAMPDEQAMMEITKQRQLIGSLGASTLFSDNVGGMGLGHPGIPGMSSGVAGIPGEYGGNGGFSHGWNGEGQPGMHPHGFGHAYAYGPHGNRGMDIQDHLSNYHSEPNSEETGQRRANIYPAEVDYGQSVRNLNQAPMVVDEAQNSQVQAQKMSEIERMVHDVSDSIDKTNKKLEAIQGGKRQITPAFTPVVSEPAAVPDIRYPVPAADRYPLGAGYIWPSANYGHQYGGPYAWSKSSTPKSEPKVEKKGGKSKVAGKENKKVKIGSKKQAIHPRKEKRSSEKPAKHHTEKIKVATKRQFLSRPYGERSDIFSPYHSSGMSMYGSGGGMGFPMSHGAGYGGHAGGTDRGFARHFHGGMGEVSGGGFGGGFQGGFPQGAYRHRIHSAHSFMPTLSGRYAGYASHEAGGGFEGGSPMGGFHQHTSMFGSGGGGAGRGYEGAGGMLSQMMGGHESGGFMGGHESGGYMGGHEAAGGFMSHEARGADPYGVGGGHSVEGGFGALTGLSGGMSSFSHGGMGGGMMEEHQPQGSPLEGSSLGHGYSQSTHFGLPAEDSHSFFGSSRHQGGGYGAGIGGPVPGGFELPGSLGGGLGGGAGGSLGSSLSSLGSGGSLGGSLEQGISPGGSSHSSQVPVDGGYLGNAAAAAGYGRPSGLEQQAAPEQPAGEAGSLSSYGYGQSQMVGGSSQAMYLPNGGVPIPTYGSDIRGLSSGMDYGLAAKRTHVPKAHHHKDHKHSE